MSEQQKRVLVVDDEPHVCDLTRRALVGAGLACDAAADGDEAFRMASTTHYEGVITDLRMPNRHGHALCIDLLNLPAPPVVVVMSALVDARLVRDLMARGVHDVLPKPINYEILATKLHAALDKKQSARTKMAPSPPPKSAARKVNLLHQIESTLVELTELWGDRLDEVFTHEGELPDPPKAVREFIRRLAESEASGASGPTPVVLPSREGRASDRVTCYTTAIATPVDRRWRANGEPFKLALRDLSEGGCRVLHTRATNAAFIAMTWSATQLVARQIRVVCAVRRCQPCGPFYDIGGQFVMAD